MNLIKTRPQANQYAQVAANISKQPVHIFETRPGTQAYERGARFGTCLDSERQDYANGGTTFVGSAKPKTT